MRQIARTFSNLGVQALQSGPLRRLFVKRRIRRPDAFQLSLEVFLSSGRKRQRYL